MRNKNEYCPAHALVGVRRANSAGPRTLGLALLIGVLTPCEAAVAQVQVGTIEPLVGRGTPKPYAPSPAREEVAWTDTIHIPDGGFIKLEFSNFELAPGDYVVVRDPEGIHREILTNANGDHFWAVSVHGDTAIVELISDGQAGGPGFDITSVGVGFTRDPLCNACGPDVECLVAHPPNPWPNNSAVPGHIYPFRRPVCAIIYPNNPEGRLYQCTGWVVA